MMRPIKLVKPSWLRRMVYSTHALAEHLGPIGIVGLAIGVFCAMFWVTAIVPLLTNGGTSVATPQTIERNSSAARESELAAFLEQLPERAQPALLVGKLNGYAAKTGVRLNGIDFQSLPGQAGELPFLILTLECSASADVLFQFVNAALQDMPYAALESMTLKRGKVSESSLDSQLSFRISARQP